MRLTKLKIDAESSGGAGGGEGVQRVALSIVVVSDVIRLTSWRRTKDARRAALHVYCDSAAKWPILWYLLKVIPFAVRVPCQIFAGRKKQPVTAMPLPLH